ncbi:MAG: hypothetical protein AB1486_33770 [Planctomycetota bacterium]
MRERELALFHYFAVRGEALERLPSTLSFHHGAASPFRAAFRHRAYLITSL